MSPPLEVLGERDWNLPPWQETDGATSPEEEGRGGGPRRTEGLKRNAEHHPQEGMENDPRPNKPKVNDDSLNVPPPALVLQSRQTHQSEAFFVNARNMTASRETRLTVDFSTHLQQERPHYIAMYFKRFATVLLSAHPSIVIINWGNTAQNPVTKAIDISPDEESISQ